MNETVSRKLMLRRELRTVIQGLSAGEQAAGSARVVGRIATEPRWQRARVVMVYIPMGGELDVLPVVEQALAQRKTVLLPRFDGAAGTYRAAVISNLKADLMRGPFGVMEPRPVCPVESLNQLDVTLVPGLGFDRVGRRLGRGKGHYDRMLTDASGEFWGIGHDCQLLPEVPEEAHDVVLNCIVTPASWIEVVPARR